MKIKKLLTKKPKLPRSFRLTARDVDLLRGAALKEEISQNEFVRRAIRENAQRVLAGKEAPQGN